MTRPQREMAVWVPESRKPMATVRRLITRVLCQPVQSADDWREAP